jgi:hypothetical protein
VRRAQLARLPYDARRSERRVVNLAASLREKGAELADALVLNLSVTGFAAETDMAVEEGQQIWLKLPGSAPLAAKVMWREGAKAGFEFAAPLHPADLETITAPERRGPPRRHFGPRPA